MRHLARACTSNWCAVTIAPPDARQITDYELRAVGHEQRHAVAFLHAQRCKPAAAAIHVTEKLGVEISCAEVDQRPCASAISPPFSSVEVK